MRIYLKQERLIQIQYLPLLLDGLCICVCVCVVCRSAATGES